VTRTFDAGRWSELHLSDPHDHGFDFVDENSGHYCTLIRVHEVFDAKIRGFREPCRFVIGHYMNVGTMKKGLVKRVARHLVREKRMGNWHVDRITTSRSATALGVVMVPWSSWTEHSLSRAVGERLGLSIPIPGFSSADCDDGCEAHLWFSSDRIFLSTLAKAVNGVVATLAQPNNEEEVR
jgi:Uri superfamily endonuclease